MRHRRLLLLLTLLGVPVVGGCKGPAARRSADGLTNASENAGASGSVGHDGADPNSLHGPDGEDQPVLELEPGPYAQDERYAALASDFDARLRRALERVGLATGLSFTDRAAPRVVLCALDDQSVPWRMEREISKGRRRAILRINIEPLVVGQADPDRVLLHALAAAAVEGGARDTRPPEWFTIYVGCLAAGDLADRLDRAARAAALANRSLRVDPADPSAAESTAFGAGLLLAERSTAADVRRLVALVADGEDPSRLLPKWIHDDAGMWVGAAREILEDAASRADTSDDATIAAARAALEALGPAGLEDFLLTARRAGTLTEAVRAEAEMLRLVAALREGQEAAARKVLDRSPPEAPILGRLKDPGSYVLLAARTQELPAGDPMRAFVLLMRFDRDFPRHPARGEVQSAMARLLGRVTPAAEAILLARVTAEGGADALDTGAVTRRVRGLLADHRPGAAGRFLASLGRRGESGDLATLVGEIDVTEAEPSPESTTANRERVARWLADASPQAERDVVDGGSVAAQALAPRLGTLEASRREDGVRLLVVATGLGRAVALLVPSWNEDPRRIEPDLAVLASSAGYADLRRTVEALYPEVKAEGRAADAWAKTGLGLEPALLAADDGLLARLYSPEFEIRRRAFEQVTGPDGAGASPAFLMHFAHDPAILLRRLAVRAAGRAGLGNVAVEGLRDPSPIVRQAACAAVVEAGAIGAAAEVAARLSEPDPDERVREAAAMALLRFAAKETRWVRPVVSILRVGDPPLAEGVSAALRDLPVVAVRRAVVAELTLEALGPGARADSAVLFRLFVAFRRASGVDAGYDPSLPLPQVRAIVARLRDEEARIRADDRSR